MGNQLIAIDERGVSDLGRQMQRMEDDLGSLVFLYTSIFFSWTDGRDPVLRCHVCTVNVHPT